MASNAIFNFAKSTPSRKAIQRQVTSQMKAHSTLNTTPAAAKPLRKTTQLKNMLKSNKMEFLMEAHNGMSARIVEEAGFKGIWGSGLSISAAMGVRDSNEASYTQVLEVLEFMADNTSIPILLDGDTGYGNFNNARRLVQKLESRGIAGVCIEDKLFPKCNSLHEDGRPQDLADIEEHSLKINAMKDVQKDEDFCVVARVESFIAGWGLEETLKRSYAYADAGADAVLIHSKLKNPSEVMEFMKHWDHRVPVVIVPTNYFRTPVAEFQDVNISTIIWANHNMRASIKAMQNATREIFLNQGLHTVEDKGLVVPVKEVFRLQNEQELKEAEKKYLPPVNREGEVDAQLEAKFVKSMQKGNDVFVQEKAALNYTDRFV